MYSEPKFKPLWLFVLAANSLLLTGSIANECFDWLQLLAMQWCGLCGVFIIYRFNDLIDQSHDLRFNLRRLLSNKLHLFFIVQFLCITVPAVFYFLSPFRIIMLSAICILGILYSVNFGNGNQSRRIKNIFIIKNLYIGLLWGSLIAVGAGSFGNPLIVALSVFASMQVFIGSIIRDIPDIDRDRENRVQSFPVMIGTKKTIGSLHLFNLASAGSIFLCCRKNELILIALVTVAWRSVTLMQIRMSGESRLWTQTFNLLTCSLILLLTLSYFIYEHY